MKIDNSIPEKTKWRTVSYLKKVEIIDKNDAGMYTTSVLNANSIRAIFFKAQSLMICQEIVELFTLNFYEVIVDLAFGLVIYHLIEIKSE